MEREKISILRIIAGISLVIFGFILVLLWYGGQGIHPGGSIKDTTPVYVLSIGVILVIVGIILLSCGKIIKIKKNTRIILTTSIIVTIVFFGWFAYDDISYRANYNPDPYYVSILFEQENNTLTVTDVEVLSHGHHTFNWEDIEIRSGNATLPSGAVGMGDVITNCTDNVTIWHIPTNIFIGSWTFD